MLQDMPGPHEPPRHLIYHILPTMNFWQWEWNVDELKKRWSLFTGKKVVAVMKNGWHKPAVRQPKLDVIESVIERFDDPSVEFLSIENDPAKREVASYHQLWQRVVNEPGYTFYAHAKGATKTIEAERRVARRWAEVMYETLLDYWPLVEDRLRDKCLAGSFRIGDNPRYDAHWHYSGTFLWVKNAEIARRPWSTAIYTPSGPLGWRTENVWCDLFHLDESACVFWDENDTNLYDEPYWTKRVEPGLLRWKEANQQYAIGSSTV